MWKIRYPGNLDNSLSQQIVLCVLRPLLFSSRGSGKWVLSSECKIYQADFTDWMPSL